MTAPDAARGGAPVGVLSRLDAWEQSVVRDLRCWCNGVNGQRAVQRAFRSALSASDARCACHIFERLVQTVTDHATRPLVRHQVGCGCLGADEAVFLHLVRCASEGHLSDAALMASLLTVPAHAEHIAILAGQAGACARRMYPDAQAVAQVERPAQARLH